MFDNAGVIHPKTPLLIEAPAFKRIHLRPQFSLTTKFALGWNKLPAELKVQILKFNLVRPNREVVVEEMDMNRYLRPYLSMGPDIAQLSREIYYKENTFLVEPRYELPRRGTLRYPPPNINHPIRRLHFFIFINRYFIRDWGRLQNLANGRYGFANLQYVWVCFAPRYAPEPELDSLEQSDKIRFECKGSVHFDWERRPTDKDAHDRSHLEKVIREFLIFQA